MGMVMKDEGGSFTPCPPGNHIGVCYSIVDLGTQHNDAYVYEGAPVAASDKPQLMISWEVPGELIEIDGVMKPAMVSGWFNAFFSERAKLRQWLEAWRGRSFSEEELMGFDLSNVLGKGCMINVTHTPAGKAKITGIAAMPKGIPAPEATNPMVDFSLQNYDQAVFDSISEGIQNIIKRSPEWQALNQPAQGFRDNAPPDDYEPAGPDEGDQFEACPF